MTPRTYLGTNEETDMKTVDDDSMSQPAFKKKALEEHKKLIEEDK
jgi:hypothetical protein